MQFNNKQINICFGKIVNVAVKIALETNHDGKIFRLKEQINKCFEKY